MNPCPCGFYPRDECRCRETDIKKYQQKLSGPIIDRIDLQVELERLSIDERFAETEKDISPKIRKRVEKARVRQDQRFEGTNIPFNAAIPGGHVRDYCQFSDAAFGYFKEVIDESRLSTRSVDRLAKVSEQSLIHKMTMKLQNGISTKRKSLLLAECYETRFEKI